LESKLLLLKKGLAAVCPLNFYQAESSYFRKDSFKKRSVAANQSASVVPL
jgi:hypothetical protein